MTMNVSIWSVCVCVCCVRCVNSLSIVAFNVCVLLSPLRLAPPLTASRQELGIRRNMIAAMQAALGDLALCYSVGGQISFDVFPQGWDKVRVSGSAALLLRTTDCSLPCRHTA